MLMPGRGGRLDASGVWQQTGAGSDLLANLSYSLPRTGNNDPLEYKATESIMFLPGFESREGDAFEAYITQDHGSGGSGSTGEVYAGGGYQYGFNGKENDNEVKGEGAQQDYGLRIYDPRLGRFLSIDPLETKFPFYTPYQFAGNTPIRFIDLDGAETYDNNAKYWSGQPLFDISKAPANGYNSAGYPRNAIWFFKQQLAAKPEMFSETNKFNINVLGRVPEVDEQWVKHNPAHASYMKQKIHHHHIDGKNMVAGIPEGLHRDAYGELHPYAVGKGIRGSKVKGLSNGLVSVIGFVSSFTGMFTGDPDSWINAFGGGEPNVGDIRKDWGETELYLEITDVQVKYTPILDKSGNPVKDKAGKIQQRIASKTVSANVYADYIWNDDSKKFQGVNKVADKSEVWRYDEKGNRTSINQML
jgi:RHS repeat-associated protein